MKDAPFEVLPDWRYTDSDPYMRLLWRCRIAFAAYAVAEWFRRQ